MGDSTSWHARRSFPFLCRVTLGLAPQVFHTEQTLLLQPRVGNYLIDHRGSGHLPVAVATASVLNRQLQAHAQGQQILDLRARPAPLFPVAHTHAPSDPLVEFGDGPVVLADAEVCRPSPQVLPQFLQPVLRENTPASARELFDPVLEVCQGLIGPAYLLALDRKAQKGAFAHGRGSLQWSWRQYPARLCWTSPVSMHPPGCRWPVLR